MNLSIMETESLSCKVSNDKQSVYVGDTAGAIKILVSGSGEVAELVSGENTITVTEKE